MSKSISRFPIAAASEPLTAPIETAINLATWQAGAGVVQQVGSPVPNGDGTETVQVQVIPPVSADTVRFIRLRVIVAD